MKEKKIEIIKPEMSHLETVLQVEQAAWPDVGEGMVAEIDKFKNRIELGCLFLLYFNGQPTGVISYEHANFVNGTILEKILDEHDQKKLLNWEEISQKYNLPPDWYKATNDGYIIKNGQSVNNPNSDCLFLIGVGVDYKNKGNGLVNHLIKYTLEQAKKMGKKYVIGYGRLPQLHENHDAPNLKDAEEHLLEKKPNTNLPADYGARFHVFNGAKAVAVIPNAMDDSESKNYGFLAIYKL
jgi:hypothetical protein